MKLHNQSPRLKLLLIVLLVAVSLTSFASNRPPKGEGRPKAPPPEAIEACKDLAKGDSVSFEDRRGNTLDAICLVVDDQLVAVPEDHPLRKDK